MKIKCSYCGNMIDDTNAQCPYCGAPNEGVVRTTSDQPLTIEELKQWYKDRHLPPPETTRFFIGIDYKNPRAFGIYKDSQTGNFVVYKNKDSGARAIRYEGTDEAYAVNELYQRLKQEILQQKALNLNKQNPGIQSNKKSAQPRGPLGEIGSMLKSFLLFFIICTVGGFICIMGIGLLAPILEDEPKDGYYEYNNAIYYYTYKDYGDDDLNWYHYLPNEQIWSAPISIEEMPPELQSRKKSKKYHLSDSWKNDIPCKDFEGSTYYHDLETGLWPADGYYQMDGHLFYHLPGIFNSNWYYYNEDWYYIEFENLPEQLQHTSLCGEFYLPEGLPIGSTVSPFEDTIYYKDYTAGDYLDRGYYSYDDTFFYHLDDLYYDGWYQYYDDDWEEISLQDLPDELQHPSKATDFYYTPTWDPATQYTDFEDTDYYKDYVKEQDSKNWDDSSDSYSYDWSSSDSWDSSSSDWGSDW